MAAIHQFVAGFAHGDAISNEALAMRAIFRGWGFDSEIFCESCRILPELRREARDTGAYAERQNPADVVLLHLSIGSPVNEAFAWLRVRKAILYHNVTPPAYFAVINPQTAATLAHAESQIRRLAGVAEVNLADSAFNARELGAFGYRSVAVFPILMDFRRLDAPSDRATRRRFDDGLTNVLVVGRGAPNKRIEDAIRIFHCYHRLVQPRSRFIHAGSFAGAERYRLLLDAQVRALGMDERSVVFAGAVPQARLNALYRSAHVLLSTSEHEGFCIPLIEAMHFDVPVLANSAAAVPETLDGSGALMLRKDPAAGAELLARLAGDGPLRRAVLAAQRERLARYVSRDLAGELRSHLSPLLPGTCSHRR